MEDFIQIIIFLGIAVIAVVQQVAKKRGKMSDAPVLDEEDDAADMPWLPVPSDDLPEERPASAPTPVTAPAPKVRLQSHSKPQSKPSAYRPVRQQPAEPLPADEVPAVSDEFGIRSAEEARKAIIWGEILQRKY